MIWRPPCQGAGASASFPVAKPGRLHLPQIGAHGPAWLSLRQWAHRSPDHGPVPFATAPPAITVGLFPLVL